MSEIYREHEYAILHQDEKVQTHFKVMADASAVAWTEYIVRIWVNLAFCRLGLPYEVDSVAETESIAPHQWRWFAVSAVERKAAL